MGDFDTSSLPDIPPVQLQEPTLTVPGYQPPPISILPPLTTSGSTSGFPASGAGTPSAMSDTFGHYADPPLAPTAPQAPAAATSPLPAGPAIPPQWNPSDPLLNFAAQKAGVNPWLADPMAKSNDTQRSINMGGVQDPGVPGTHVFNAPSISF